VPSYNRAGVLHLERVGWERMIDRIEKARTWLGNRWLLAEPIAKPVRTARIYQPVENRWATLNQQIASILAGSEHV